MSALVAFALRQAPFPRRLSAFLSEKHRPSRRSSICREIEIRSHPLGVPLSMRGKAIFIVLHIFSADATRNRESIGVGYAGAET